MRFKLTLRNAFVLAFALSFIGLIGAFVLLRWHDTPTSPTSVLQWYGLAACALAALLGAIHDSRGFARRLYAVLMLAAICLSLSSVVSLLMTEKGMEPTPSASFLVTHLPFAAHLEEALFGNRVAPSTSDTAADASPESSIWLFGDACLALLALWQTCRKTPERRRFG